MNDFDVIVAGGGAAGLMCALTAGKRGRRVVVLEGSNKIGKKILMSGGGRCNFTHLSSRPANFLSDNPRFCISALSRYQPHDFVAMVERHDIPYHEKTPGQLFCDRSSKDIVAMLRAECDKAGVQIETHSPVELVEKQAAQYVVSTPRGRFRAPSLVIATGGLSIPKMGASDIGYRIARQFGLPVLETRAGLVPFTFTGVMQEMMTRLAGVALPAAATCGNTRFDEAILFTHRGLSGPATLQVSSYWHPGDRVVIDLLPGQDAAQILVEAKSQRGKSRIRSVLNRLLPRALVGELQPVLWPGLGERALAEVADGALHQAGMGLNAWPLTPAATEGYRTAEVTLGGVDTTALSSQTMESLGHPGLYFIGEVVDVTGHLGGHNFQWAWASGHATGSVA